MKLATIDAVSNDLVRCVPFSTVADYKYLIKLAGQDKYTAGTEEEFEQALLHTEGYFWSIFDKETNIKIGVLYFTLFDKILWLHAYRDNDIIKARLDIKKPYGMSTAELLIQYAEKNLVLRNEIFTSHPVKNRGATIICKKLNFKIMNTYQTPVGDYVLMRR